jgi:hypothetical protein
MRVYRAYSNGVQFSTRPASNYCQSTLMRGALAMIILNYINLLVFIAIFVLTVVNARKKRQEKDDQISTS